MFFDVFCVFGHQKKILKIFWSRPPKFFGLDQVCTPLFDKKTLENKRKNPKI